MRGIVFSPLLRVKGFADEKVFKEWLHSPGNFVLILAGITTQAAD